MYMYQKFNALAIVISVEICDTRTHTCIPSLMEEAGIMVSIKKSLEKRLRTVRSKLLEDLSIFASQVPLAIGLFVN